MTTKELNSRLKETRLVCDEYYDYGRDDITYDAWLEYKRKDGKWGVLHQLGKFTEERFAVESALKKIQMDGLK